MVLKLQNDSCLYIPANLLRQSRFKCCKRTHIWNRYRRIDEEKHDAVILQSFFANCLIPFFRTHRTWIFKVRGRAAVLERADNVLIMSVRRRSINAINGNAIVSLSPVIYDALTRLASCGEANGVQKVKRRVSWCSGTQTVRPRAKMEMLHHLNGQTMGRCDE